MNISKIHTLHNLKSVNPLVEPVVPQTVIFMVFEETKVVKVTYLMGDSIVPHTMINVPLYHFNLAMELQQGKAYDLPILDARAIWNYLVDKLGWVNVA